MTLLAIDTATQYLSLALRDGESLLADCAMQVGRGHNEALAPLIEQLMARTGVTMAQLQALAVAVGPGSYTGVRIGVALAKGMAAARGLPLIGVTTLETLVAAVPPPHEEAPRELFVTLPAGRNRIIYATYYWDKGSWRQDAPARTATWQEALAACARPMQGNWRDIQRGLGGSPRGGTCHPARADSLAAGRLAGGDCLAAAARSRRGGIPRRARRASVSAKSLRRVAAVGATLQVARNPDYEAKRATRRVALTTRYHSCSSILIIGILCSQHKETRRTP